MSVENVKRESKNEFKKSDYTCYYFDDVVKVIDIDFYNI